MVAKSSLLFVLTAALTVGCGSFHVVSEARTGGTLALDGAHSRAHDKAEQYMRAHCPGGFEIVEEGDTMGDTDATREWRIAYRCTGSPNVAMIAF